MEKNKYRTLYLFSNPIKYCLYHMCNGRGRHAYMMRIYADKVWFGLIHYSAFSAATAM